jgi:cysteinyl-tRNA synthetase
LFELATEINKTASVQTAGLLKALGGCIGLLQQDPGAWLQGRVRVTISATQDDNTVSVSVSVTTTELIAQRAAAKAAKNFAEADRIRNELLAKGIVLKDSAGGTEWEVVQ